MEEKLKKFLLLEQGFSSRGYSLYLVGGTVRDYLLGKELTDIDIVTDATPSEMKEFLPEADYTFEKYGSVKVVLGEDKYDITTLRKEDDYKDSRHPQKVVFTKSLNEDVYRRDLTINAIYMDKNLEVIDLVGGVKDLKDKLLVMVGDPEKRILEDPLRIIRIYRFMLELDFSIEKNLNKVINKNFDKVRLLNKDKIVSEIKKSTHQRELIEILKSHDINVEIK